MTTIAVTPEAGTAAYISAAYDLLGTMRAAWATEDAIGVEVTTYQAYMQFETPEAWQRAVDIIGSGREVRLTKHTSETSIHRWAETVIDGITVRAIYLEDVAS